MLAVPHAPSLGAELRAPLEYVSQRVHAELTRAGFTDIRPAHLTVFHLLPPDGLRTTRLAAAARMTKQSMGALIDHLELRGYVERAPDSSDGRARLVRLTTRGQQLTAMLRHCMDEVEREWERGLGPRRYGQFREALDRLNGIVAANGNGHRHP